MRRTTTFPARGHNAMASWQKVTPFLAGGLELCLDYPSPRPPFLRLKSWILSGRVKMEVTPSRRQEKPLGKTNSIYQER
ncbi:hypothetical protein MOOR_16940 [Moorella thermoacetica]|uniref:Uncharacterized protein n=1 Tax=Neomoorella thermoacetica TaxID=1525 RepID=A0A1J5JGV1_NEOTH|nr:hypothetical protein [Moorella thermoacetica]OIQ08774.1 hypothetical protein MOOR_16940 [Moorella thermoacetica]